MTAVLTPAQSTISIAARAVEAVKVYGRGDTAVRAFDGVPWASNRTAHGHHGPFGLG